LRRRRAFDSQREEELAERAAREGGPAVVRILVRGLIVLPPLTDSTLEQLDTPAMLVDLAAADRNIGD
jgi:hypothetical protein